MSFLSTFAAMLISAIPIITQADRDPYPFTECKEGIFLGYRGVDHFGVKPMYPFGYGLSYSSYGYSALRIETVMVVLPRSAFSYYSTAEYDWVFDPSEYRILVGASSEDIRLTGKL